MSYYVSSELAKISLDVPKSVKFNSFLVLPHLSPHLSLCPVVFPSLPFPDSLISASPLEAQQTGSGTSGRTGPHPKSVFPQHNGCKSSLIVQNWSGSSWL